MGDSVCVCDIGERDRVRGGVIGHRGVEGGELTGLSCDANRHMFLF